MDVSDDAIEQSEKSTESFWSEDIEPVLLNAEPGTKIILDDAPDTKIHKYLQKFLIRYLRTGRHKRVGVTSIQHNLRGAQWTSQSFSSVKWITLMVRGGGKGKLVDWLYETLGIGRRRSRELVELFAEEGRTMNLHQWSPPVLFGEKYAVWV